MLKEKEVVTALDNDFEIRKVVCGTAIGYASDTKGHILQARFDAESGRLLSTISRPGNSGEREASGSECKVITMGCRIR